MVASVGGPSIVGTIAGGYGIVIDAPNICTSAWRIDAPPASSRGASSTGSAGSGGVGDGGGASSAGDDSSAGRDSSEGGDSAAGSSRGGVSV
jgi:hypothetical protein